MMQKLHFQAGTRFAPAPSERGQELVEFALTFPVLFLLLLGILDMGRATYYNSVLYNSAREGARYGIIYPDDAAGIETAARNLAVGLYPADLTVSSARVSSGAADNIQVVLNYQFTPVTPVIAQFFGAAVVTVTNQATMQIEE